MKTKLTKKQRHEIYKECLKHHLMLEQSSYVFLCHLISGKSNMQNFKMIDEFPEFSLFQPIYVNFGDAWFDGNYDGDIIKEHQRVILQFCIEMTK